jgi:hypothetical protein
MEGGYVRAGARDSTSRPSRTQLPSGPVNVSRTAWNTADDWKGRMRSRLQTSTTTAPAIGWPQPLGHPSLADALIPNVVAT